MSDNRDALKREAAEQAAAMVEDGMVVGLGTGSTAAFFIAALIARARAGLNIAGIPTSERSATQAREGGLTLVDFSTHQNLDLTVDGADEIKRDNLDLIKGLGGALLREKIVASASRRLIIVADDEKLVDWLGAQAPVPVEVVRFGWEVAASRIAALGAEAVRRVTPDDEAVLTDGGNYILDCHFGEIADPRAINRKLLDIVGVVETGLFIGMTTLALVADGSGVRRYTPKVSPAIQKLVLVVMGVSGAGKSTIAKAMNDTLHWPFQEGDDLHPPRNIAKMKAGTPLDDADRAPWLAACAAWIADRLDAHEPGLITCSALKRRYRDTLLSGRPGARLLYLHADQALLEERLRQRTGHFMPPSLLASQLATLEPPTADEHPIIVDVAGTADETVARALAALSETYDPAPASTGASR